MTSNFIPNSFQTPNGLVDQYMELLTADEFKVLIYAVRHILGWKDKIASRCANISLTMFVQGFDSGGKHYGGCGLSRPKVNRALGELVKYGLMEKAGPATKEGQEWRLTFDDAAAVDCQGLQARAESASQNAAKRVAKATSASAKKRGSGTTAVPVEGYDSRTDAGTMAVPITGTTVVHNTNTVKPNQTTTTTAPGVVVDVDFDLRKKEAEQIESEALALVAVKGNGAEPHHPAESDALAAVVAAYEDNIGLVTQMIRDELIDAVDEYPQDWIIDAIRVAVTQNVRKWKYVLAVLENWKKNGRTDARLNGKTQAKAAADKRKTPPVHYPRPVPDCPMCGGLGQLQDGATGKTIPCPYCLAREDEALAAEGATDGDEAAA